MPGLRQLAPGNCYAGSRHAAAGAGQICYAAKQTWQKLYLAGANAHEEGRSSDYQQAQQEYSGQVFAAQATFSCKIC